MKTSGEHCSDLEFSSCISEKYKEQADISVELNASVTRLFKGFRVVIQPQVLAESGKIFGGEVLLRWKNRDVDVSPNIFIPILEQTGLIVPVGKWMINESIAVCREILHIYPNFQLSFNISYLQLIDETLSLFIQNALETFEVPGENILIELTETHFNSHPERLENFIKQCKEIGVRFALDDFGSAYSNLLLLLKYSADIIKLDRELLRETVTSQEKLDFIMSIIQACHKFGKKICVEGVETKEELEKIQGTKCDFIQGYYFYKPLELDELYSTLKKEKERPSVDPA